MAIRNNYQRSILDTEVLNNMTPFAYELINVTVSSQRLTESAYAPSGASPARMAIVTPELNTLGAGGNFRWRYAAAPTSTVGHQLSPTVQYLVFESPYLLLRSLEEIVQFQFIRGVSSGTFSIQVTYFR